MKVIPSFSWFGGFLSQNEIGGMPFSFYFVNYKFLSVHIDDVFLIFHGDCVFWSWFQMKQILLCDWTNSKNLSRLQRIQSHVYRYCYVDMIMMMTTMIIIIEFGLNLTCVFSVHVHHLCVYMCVCMYVHMYIYIYIYIYKLNRIHDMCMCIYIYTHMYEYSAHMTYATHTYKHKHVRHWTSM